MCFYGCANRDRYCENETSETEMSSYVKPFDKETAVKLSEQSSTGVYTYNRIMTELNDCIDRGSKRGQKKTYLTVTLYQQDISILDKIVQDFEAAKYKAKFEAIKIPHRYKITVDWSKDESKYRQDAFDNAKNDNDELLNQTIASLVVNDEGDKSFA